MKILHLSDSVLHPTGYANQSRLLCQTLQKAGNQVFTLGHNHHGMPIRNWEFEDGTKQNYTLLPTDGSPYARNAVHEYFVRYKPDMFGILLDTFMLLQAQITDWQIPAKSYFWYPSDGGWFPKFCEQVLKKIDYPVAMAKFGQDQAKRLFDIKAHYIPHGCFHEDTKVLTSTGELRIKDIVDNKLDVDLIGFDNGLVTANTVDYHKIELKDSMLLVITESGRFLEITKDNPVLVNDLVYKPAGDLELNDKVYIPNG